MVTEAALLGTPAIRSNSFVGDDDMGNFVELENQGLIHNVASVSEIVDRSRTVLDSDGVGETWQRKRDEFLADKANLTDVIVDVATAHGRVGALDSLQRFGGASRPEPTGSVGVGSD